MAKSSLDLSRRSFLQLALLTTACGGGEASRGGGGGSAGAGGDGGGGGAEVPFGVWREIREGIRQSPDHLVEEAARVVASKDAEAIFRFVRDRIVAIPGRPNELGDERARAWGARGTLRSGLGTLRDKAELLVELYERAGWSAKVVPHYIDPDPEFAAKVYGRKVDRTFVPRVSEAQLARWRELLHLSAPPAAVALDDDGSEAAALADSLLSVLPPSVTAPAFDLRAPSAIPNVEVSVGGEQRICNVTFPGLAFGEAGNTRGRGTDGGGLAFAPITVTLSALLTTDPGAPVELVTASFDASEAVGRSLYVQMVPVGDFEGVMSSSVQDLRAFIPALALRGADMPEAERERYTWSGSALTLHGQIYSKDPSGGLRVDGKPIETSEASPATLARVKTLELGVNASRHPVVSVRVSALDGAGASVSGLSGSAFLVKEQGVEQGALLLENRASSVRVVFLLDESTSLPAAFQGAGAASLLRSLATELRTSEPTCSFCVFAVGASRATASYTTDPQKVYQRVLDNDGVSSDLWDSLAVAATFDPTVIVFISDGEPTDVRTPAVVARLAKAPPIVYLQVGGTTPSAFHEMAALTGGSVHSVTSQAQAITEARAFIEASRKYSTLLQYVAPVEGPRTRRVEVSLRGGSAVASVSYDVPAQATEPPRVAGLLLRLRVGSEDVTRVLAGVPRVVASTSAQVFDEVARAFLGVHELRFEGGPPTAAVVLDDLITTRLGLEPLWVAAKQGDAQRLRDALLSTPPTHAAACFALHTALSAPAGTVLYPSGLRAVRHSLVPLDARRMVRQVDVLPIGAYRAAIAEGRAALEAAARATARLALVEAASFERTTQGELTGKALIVVPPYASVQSVVSGMSPEQIERWISATSAYDQGYRLVPQGGAPVAFWYLDPKTGSLLPVLDDGSGGGQSIQDWAADANTTLDYVDRAASLLGAAGVIGTAAGTWLALQIVILKKLIAATVIIGGGDSPYDPTRWSDAACAAVSGAAGGALDAAGHLGGLLGLLGQLGSGVMDANDVVQAGTGQSLLC